MKTYPYTRNPKIRSIMAQALNITRLNIKVVDPCFDIERQKAIRHGARLALISAGILLIGEVK